LHIVREHVIKQAQRRLAGKRLVPRLSENEANTSEIRSAVNTNNNTSPSCILDHNLQQLEALCAREELLVVGVVAADAQAVEDVLHKLLLLRRWRIRLFVALNMRFVGKE
jgi:hypothetical protein